MHESDPYFRGVWIAPNSDGFRLHSIDLARVGGYEASLADMPTPEMLDRAVAQSSTGSRPRLEDCGA